ncbi:MAG TPA: D-2-hydroxyacid dehydrogenase [Bacillota bacterium]
MPAIVSTMELTDRLREQIRLAAPGHTLIEVDRRDVAAQKEAAREAEIWFGFGPSAEVFAEARGLRWVQSTTAGVDRLLHPALVDSDVIVTNVRGMHADTIGDHVLMGMLALARNLPRLVHQQAARRWAPVPVAELSGDTLGIIGLGAIGQAVARRGAACGMRVIGTRRRAGTVAGVDEVFGPEGREQVLRRSRWVVLACPLTAETRGLIGPRELGWMEGGFLINIGRGALVQEPALIAALEDGRLAGAFLDVFDEEPLPETSPLWRLPNVLITPHIGGGQRDYAGRAVEIFVDNLARYRQGSPLRNLVDKQAGY